MERRVSDGELVEYVEACRSVAYVCSNMAAMHFRMHQLRPDLEAAGMRLERARGRFTAADGRLVKFLAPSLLSTNEGRTFGGVALDGLQAHGDDVVAWVRRNIDFVVGYSLGRIDRAPRAKRKRAVA